MKMKPIYSVALKVIILIILILLVGTGITILVGALQEKPPEHPLDFEDIKKVVLSKSINSVGDGLPYALDRARDWRKDAVLTGLQIISVGQDEITDIKGKFNYSFEFAYIDKNKPAGILFVSVNTDSNSIESVRASHDGEDKTRKVEELKTTDLERNVKKVYEVAIVAIGKENIFKYEQPFVRVNFNSDFATFELSPSQVEPNKIVNSVKIDMKTYEIIKPKE